MISFRNADLMDRVKSQSRVLNDFLPRLQMIAPAYTTMVFYEDPDNYKNSPIEKVQLAYMQFIFELVRDGGKIVFEIGNFNKVITAPREVVDLINHFTSNPDLVKTADLIDKIKPRFRWIFDSNSDLDRFVSHEDDKFVYSQGKHTSTAAQKSSGVYRRPGWIFGMHGIKSNESPFTENDGQSGRKDLFLNNKFIGKITNITNDGYVETSLTEQKIDPAKVKIVDANQKIIKLEYI